MYGQSNGPEATQTHGGDQEDHRDDNQATLWQEDLEGRKVGDFVIGARMGQGGYGVIYRVWTTER